MNLRKALKKKLSDKYVFRKYMSNYEIKRKLIGTGGKEERLVASLTIGCVKVNLFLFLGDEIMQTGFDILVKDNLESKEWICFDSFTKGIKLTSYNLEQSMFEILNEEVEEYSLSYTECNFDVVEGKSVVDK